MLVLVVDLAAGTGVVLEPDDEALSLSDDSLTFLDGCGSDAERLVYVDFPGDTYRSIKLSCALDDMDNLFFLKL